MLSVVEPFPSVIAIPPNAPDAFESHRASVRARLRASGIVRSGPGSTSWKLNREILVVAGWGRAILLQFAHPLVAAGVGDHSRFRGGLGARLTRLRSTIRAMLSLTFGDDEEAIAVAARINTIHDHVSGRLRGQAGSFPDGAAYSAHDSALLRWVHVTLIDSIPAAYELLVGPLTRAERDAYCAESSVIEPLLGVAPGLLPLNARDLDAAVREELDSGRIAVTQRSRELAHAVLFPPAWRLFWPVFRPVQLITIGLLPGPIRQAYGFAWTAREARALSRWAAAIRAARRVAPGVLREWPCARRQPPANALLAVTPARIGS